MTTRQTAYCHKVETIYDPAGDVTVEVYVLWPAGGQRFAADLLMRVSEDVLGEVQGLPPPPSKVWGDRKPTQ